LITSPYLHARDQDKILPQPKQEMESDQKKKEHPLRFTEFQMSRSGIEMQALGNPNRRMQGYSKEQGQS